MKFKYFLRGFGIGIIFAAVVCLVAFQSDTNKMSDKEVVERAKELGLVEQEDTIEDFFNSEQESKNEQGTEENTKKQDVTEGENVSEDENVEESTIETTTIDSGESETTTTESEDVLEENTEAQESTTEQIVQTVTITIEGGSSSFPVCQKLQELGLIESAGEFDNYLVENGYASRIRVGTHTLTIGMSFEEIAVAISDPM